MFKELLFEYQSNKIADKKRDELWWKNEAWNQADPTQHVSAEKVATRKDKVERAFSKKDKIWQTSSSLRSTVDFLVQNKILAGVPDCDKCGLEMEGASKSKNPVPEAKGYHCKTCLTRKTVKHSSFLDQCRHSLQLFVRCSFYYFVKGYDPDLAHREMTENSSDGIGIGNNSSSVKYIYAICRERVSREALRSIHNQKLGGEGKEVVVDFMKLALRNKKTAKNEEWLVLAFMEKEKNGRCRGYVIPNIKVQTIALYMSKTIAPKSVVYTPFYQETGWEFLNKFFEHRRLTKTKDGVIDYNKEKDEWTKLSGFGVMWKNLRSIDLAYITYTVEGRKFGISENLQMFVDEQIWKTQHRTIEQRRKSLAAAFHADRWQEENASEDFRLGIGGGYGQFGILTEEEFLMTLKTAGKRTQKFTEHANQFRGQYIPRRQIDKKNDGLEFMDPDSEEPSRKRQRGSQVTSTQRSQIGGTPISAFNEEQELENSHEEAELKQMQRPRSPPKVNFNKLAYDPQFQAIPEVDIEALAEKRFGYQKEPRRPIKPAPAEEEVIEIDDLLD